MKAATQEKPVPKPHRDGRAATSLEAHEKSIETFVCWQKGSRAQLVASVSAALRATTSTMLPSDVSHLSDAPRFECGRSPIGEPSIDAPASSSACGRSSAPVAGDLMFGSASRRERIRQRVTQHSPEALVLMYKDLGACAIPKAVVDLLSKGGTGTGTGTAAVMSLPQMWQRSVTTFEATKPPSRADAVAVATAMQFMHRAVDAAYDDANKQPQKQQQAPPLRSILKAPALPGGLASTLAGAEEQWLLEHLAVVDIGFAELIRQVKVHCLERGALLNHVRETFFDYLGDFLSSEKTREANISLKERELQDASQRFADTCEALADAKETIVSLEAEVRRLETLQKYTVAKHIRDKQRLTRKHEVRRDSKEKRSDASAPKASSGASSSSEVEDLDGTYDDEEDEDTLSTMVRRKREEEPKLRRPSMAKPLLVPSQFPHVRDRPRARAVERVDASMMTEPVFFRSKLPEPLTPAPPPVETPRPRRERLASVSLVKDVTHHYTQTDPTTPHTTDLTGQRTGGAAPAAGTDGDPPPPLARRRSSIVQSNATQQLQRFNAEEVRMRIAVAKAKPRNRSAASNASVQASATMCNAEVQQVPAVLSTGTQTSVLLQLQASGAFQQSLAAPATHTAHTPVVSPSAPPLSKQKDATAGTTPSGSRRPSPAQDTVRRTVSPDAATSLGRTISPEGSYMRGGDASYSRGADCVSPSQRSSTSSISHGGRPRFATNTQSTQTNAVVISDVVAGGGSGGINQIVVTSPATSPRSGKSPRKAAGGAGRAASHHGGNRTQAGQVAKLPPIRAATPTTNPSRRTAAAAIAPLTEADLASSMESSDEGGSPVGLLSPTTTTTEPTVVAAQSTTIVPKTPTAAAKLRNIKWMVAAAAEVHLAAVQYKFGPSDDPLKLMVKHFRTKYGFEKVADGYAKDFFNTLEVFVAASADQSSPTTTAATAALPYMGTYPRHAVSGSDAPPSAPTTLLLHRRLYAFAQFMGLSPQQPTPPAAWGVHPNQAFHMKGYLFYLHVLEAFRARGGKAFLKELTDDVCVRVPPRVALSTLEHALRDRFALPLLELYLLAVQGAMLRYDADPLQYDPSVANLVFPHGHQHFTDVKACEALLPQSDASAPFSVPTQFVSFDAPVMWDLDLLLEVLVTSYDAVVRPLITASQQVLASGSL